MFRIKSDSFWGKKIAKIEELAFERAETELKKSRNGRPLDQREEKMLRKIEQTYQQKKQQRQKEKQADKKAPDKKNGRK